MKPGVIHADISDPITMALQDRICREFFALDRTSGTKSCGSQDNQVRILMPVFPFLRSSPLSLTLPSFIEKKNLSDCGLEY